MAIRIHKAIGAVLVAVLSLGVTAAVVHSTNRLPRLTVVAQNVYSDPTVGEGFAELRWISNTSVAYLTHDAKYHPLLAQFIPALGQRSSYKQLPANISKYAHGLPLLSEDAS